MDSDSGLQRQGSLQRSGSGITGPTGIKVTIKLQRLGSRAAGGARSGSSAQAAPGSAAQDPSRSPAPPPSSGPAAASKSAAAVGAQRLETAAVAAVVRAPGHGSAVVAGHGRVGAPAALLVEVTAEPGKSTDAQGNAARRGAAALHPGRK